MNIDKDLDCIIVGSGPGGATVAWELSRKKRCSVIPEAWGLPPTSTIIGLGKRLAKHLAAEKPVSDVRREDAPATHNLEPEGLAV